MGCSSVDSVKWYKVRLRGKLRSFGYTSYYIYRKQETTEDSTVTRSKLSEKSAVNLELHWKIETLLDAGVVTEQMQLARYSRSLSKMIYREDPASGMNKMNKNSRT